MNSNILKIVSLVFVAFLFTQCNEPEPGTTEPSFEGTYTQNDQMGRPAINTVFVPSAKKDLFNTKIPSEMAAAYGNDFGNTLMALNAGYTTNALGQDSAAIVGLLVTDVLNVSTTGTTTFFDGTNVLTGRNLTDDVMNTELLLLFGGPAGADNPTLTNDNVNSNDKAFLTSFPYLAAPF
jgi:hypothetical protein